MGLNISKGNMYDFITHTFNTIKGECYHDCSYCYMKRWGKLKPARFDKKELKTNLGSGNFIFVGSSNDLFAENIPKEWIESTLWHCGLFNNKYLFQTKNPKRLFDFTEQLPKLSSICTTIESNRSFPEIQYYSPKCYERSKFMRTMQIRGIETYVTIEPILDFDLDMLTHMMKRISPIQINIGADSGGNNLPEPKASKILALIAELEKFTKVKQKKNLKRLLK